MGKTKQPDSPHPNPTRRFSDRVADYVRYRPGYPDGVVEILEREAGLTPASVVADLGSGTGISARLFLARGCRVFGVEPNREMRRAAEELRHRTLLRPRPPAGLRPPPRLRVPQKRTSKPASDELAAAAALHAAGAPVLPAGGGEPHRRQQETRHQGRHEQG